VAGSFRTPPGERPVAPEVSVPRRRDMPTPIVTGQELRADARPEQEEESDMVRIRIPGASVGESIGLPGRYVMSGG